MEAGGSNGRLIAIKEQAIANRPGRNFERRVKVEGEKRRSDLEVALARIPPVKLLRV